MRHVSALFLCVVLSACAGAESGSSGTDPGGGGGGGNGGGGGGGSGPDDGGDANVQPTYPQQHPRILLGTRGAALKAALAANTPAASRFRSTIDQWIAGADYWGMTAWQAALLGALTGEQKYCTKAVSI